MGLSQNLIDQFVKLTNKDEKPSEVTVNGTYKNINGKEYVQIDGSEILTPVTSTVDAETGERVQVMIKNHTAIITGNISSPSARSKSVQDLKVEVDEHGNSIQQLDNNIQQQNNSIIQIDNNIKQVNNDIIQANNAINQQGNLITQLGNDITQQGNTIEQLNNDITQKSNEIEQINNTLTQHNNTITQQGNTITQQGNLITQQGNEITQQGNLISQQGNTILEQGNKITAVDSNITILNSAFKIQDGVLTGLSEIIVNELMTNSLNAKYANIDFTNINQAAVTKIFSESGIIKDLIVSEGKITGELVGVTIKGDLIEGNTLKADKLVIKGSDGLYYKLNVDSLGETTASADPKYQNGLDGSVIIAQSIVAEKIAVDDLVAFDATIGGFKITEKSIYSGVKSTVGNTTRGIYMDNDGQFSVGDSNNFIKYFKDTNNVFKLEISAGVIQMGGTNKTLQETLDEMKDDLNNFEIDTGNLLFNGQKQKPDSSQWTGTVIIGDYDDLPPTDEALFKSRIYSSGTTTSYYIPFDKNKKYKISTWLKAIDQYKDSSTNFYPSIYILDMDKQVIGYNNVIYYPDTVTTLSQDLNPGDTIVHATSLSGWSTNANDHGLYLAFYNYKSSTGYKYETYTRNIIKLCENGDDKKAYIHKDTNTITLQSPYNGPVIPAGTKISQNYNGSTYYYPFNNIKFNQVSEWTYKETIFDVNSNLRLKDARYIKLLPYTSLAWYCLPKIEDVTDKEMISKTVKQVDVEYYLSTSSTTATDGSWSTTAPEWVNGKFMWSRQIVTYVDGTTATRNATCIAGATGSNGAAGATGTGIDSITEEYYLSTSKTTQTGGSWVTTPPAWSANKYIWTRSKIVYKNPASTAYTTPLCSSEWEAVNDIKIGGRNLLLKSDVPVTNNGYPMTTYIMSENMLPNVEYTVTIWGTLGTGKVYWSLYLNGGSIPLGSLKNNGDGSFSCTFKGKENAGLNPNKLYVYPMVRDTVVESTITKIKLEYGNKSTDWTPAPEDIDDNISNVRSQLSEVVVGTQTSTTAEWTGNASFSSLKNNQQITYWLPQTSSSNATLNLTLSDGTETGAKPLYYGGTTRINTHYPAGSVIHLTYRTNVTIGTTTIAEGWWADANYDSGNTYDRIRFNQSIKATLAVTAGQLLMATSNGYKPLAPATDYNIDKPVLWAGSNITANATGTNNYLSYPLCDLTKNINTTWTQYETAYLKGTLNGNIFTTVSGTYIITTKPTTEDGYYYMSLGYMTTTKNMILYPEHPLFKFIDGKFMSLSQVAYEAQNDIDNLEIGGRNLLLKSNEFFLTSSDNPTYTKRSSDEGKITVLAARRW